MNTSIYHRKSRRGGILISALAFTAIGSFLIVGVLTMTLSHYARAKTEADYDGSLALAEAGINYELRKLSANANSGDQIVAGVALGSHTLGPGSFSVYCSNKDGTTPWIVPNPLYVNSLGTINGVSRMVRVSAKGFAWTGRYAVYSVDHLSTWHGSSIDVVGDVGTDNQLSFSGTPGISGSVYFNGPNAGWAGGIPQPGYTEVHNPTPQTWATVDEIALKKFPAGGAFGSGGLTYLATNNNNLTANPPIVNNSITDDITLTGPGDYYVTNIDLTGNKKINFNNTNGPVNLWIGPSNGTGTARFRGGTGAISATADASKMNNIYVATNSGIDMAGNETVDAVVYAYNKTSTGTEIGAIQFSGNPTVNGQVLANQVDINGNVTINYIQGVNKQTNFAYWGFDDQWSEINGM